MDMSLSKSWVIIKDRGAWHAADHRSQRVGDDLATEQQLLSAIKKAECQRIEALELWYWRRLLRVSWTARRSNQSILKESNPEYSLEVLRLRIQYSGHLR